MHTLKLKLRLAKYQYQYLNKVFFLAYRMYVRCVKYAQKQIRKFGSDKQYKHNKYLYIKYKNKLSEYENLLKDLDKKLVQRDLYSAYIIKNVEDLENINKSKCKKDFKKFIKNQEQEFKRIKDSNIKNKNFGI